MLICSIIIFLHAGTIFFFISCWFCLYGDRIYSVSSHHFRNNAFEDIQNSITYANYANCQVWLADKLCVRIVNRALSRFLSRVVCCAPKSHVRSEWWPGINNSGHVAQSFSRLWCSQMWIGGVRGVCETRTVCLPSCSLFPNSSICISHIELSGSKAANCLSAKRVADDGYTYVLYHYAMTFEIHEHNGNLSLDELHLRYGSSQQPDAESLVIMLCRTICADPNAQKCTSCVWSLWQSSRSDQNNLQHKYGVRIVEKIIVSQCCQFVITLRDIVGWR